MSNLRKSSPRLNRIRRYVAGAKRLLGLVLLALEIIKRLLDFSR
jgi:hypothetical protein